MKIRTVLRYAASAVPTVMQLAGLVALIVGSFLLAGLEVGLLLSGLILILAGAVAEVDQRRRTGHELLHRVRAARAGGGD